MSTRHLVDPELLPMIDMMAEFRVDRHSLTQLRAMRGELFGLVAPETPPEVVHISGPEGAPAVPLRISRPPGAATGRPAIYHIHGGGFVIGDAEMGDLAARIMADRHDALVASVDYRLAPETPFPGPIEDCYAGLAWLIAHAQPLGIDVERIVIMGESAGGGLAAALALMARDRGGPMIAGQMLIYPMLDHRTGGDADPYSNERAGEFGWTRASNRFGWASMRGVGTLNDSRAHHFSPSLADDLAGLPPAFVAVGALDLFVDEDIDYARRLIAAGVPTELHVYPGAPHGFNVMADAAVSRRFARDLDDAMARMLAKRAPEV